MFFSAKDKGQPTASKEETAHEVWTRDLFEKISKIKHFNVNILEATKTVSTSGDGRPRSRISFRFDDAVLTYPVELVSSEIHFAEQDEEVTLDDGSVFTAQQGVGYYWLNSCPASEIGKEVKRKREEFLGKANAQAILGPMTLPAVEFAIFARFIDVQPDLYAACMNAKVQGRVAQIRFIAVTEISWPWEHFAADPKWLNRKFPLQDFVFWDRAEFREEALRHRRGLLDL